MHVRCDFIRLDELCGCVCVVCCSRCFAWHWLGLSRLVRSDRCTRVYAHVWDNQGKIGRQHTAPQSCVGTLTSNINLYLFGFFALEQSLSFYHWYLCSTVAIVCLCVLLADAALFRVMSNVLIIMSIFALILEYSHRFSVNIHIVMPFMNTILSANEYYLHIETRIMKQLMFPLDLAAPVIAIVSAPKS